MNDILIITNVKCIDADQTAVNRIDRCLRVFDVNSEKHTCISPFKLRAQGFAMNVTGIQVTENIICQESFKYTFLMRNGEESDYNS